MIELNRRKMRQRKIRRRHGDTLMDDEFSEDLKSQGELGAYFRILYLRNPMILYIKKVEDESIRY